MVIQASSVSIYCPKITASATTIINGKYIETVQERIQLITNNYFTSDDLSIQSTAIFNATARAITLNSSTEHWEDYGFQANDDFLIYSSYRNDSVKTIESLLDNVLTVTSSCSVVKEDFNNSEGPVIYFSVVQWPQSIITIAAKMIYFDTDFRDKNVSGLKSRSLGPLSESFGSSEVDDLYGYPRKLIDDLCLYRIARLM
jgi:hypothetical protein